MIPKFKLKECFLCNFCREICNGSCSEIKLKILNGKIKPNSDEYEKNKDLACDRKQIIDCLGKFCDKKCKLNKEDAYKDIDVEILFRTIKYLGNKVNELIEENNDLNRLLEIENVNKIIAEK